MQRENQSTKEITKEIFNESLRAELFKIFSDLNEIIYFTPETISNDTVDKISTKLQKLAKDAAAVAEHEKEEILKQIESAFYILHTIGVVDNRERFGSEVGRAIQLVEVALLAFGGPTGKKVLDTIKERIKNNRNS